MSKIGIKKNVVSRNHSFNRFGIITVIIIKNMRGNKDDVMKFILIKI